MKPEACTTEAKPSAINSVVPEVAVKEEVKAELEVQPEGRAEGAPKLGVKPEAGTGADDATQDLGVGVGVGPNTREDLGEAGPVNMEEAAPVNNGGADLDEGGARPENQPGGGAPDPPVTIHEVEKVQAMIESCLQLYMSKHEVINILQVCPLICYPLSPPVYCNRSLVQQPNTVLNDYVLFTYLEVHPPCITTLRTTFSQSSVASFSPNLSNMSISLNLGPFTIAIKMAGSS